MKLPSVKKTPRTVICPFCKGGVRHGLESVCGLVLDEKAALRIQPVLLLGDSKNSRESGMRTCEWRVEDHAVVLFKCNIFAEDQPMASPGLLPFSNWATTGGVMSLRRICMLGTHHRRPRDPSVSGDATRFGYPRSSLRKAAEDQGQTRPDRRPCAQMCLPLLLVAMRP